MTKEISEALLGIYWYLKLYLRYPVYTESSTFRFYVIMANSHTI